MQWGWQVTVRPARGFCGSSVPFVRRGHRSAGRRLIPALAVSALWLRGLSTREIAEALGAVGGSKFNPIAISCMINVERKKGHWGMFPYRRSGDDGEIDMGVDRRTVRALGL